MPAMPRRRLCEDKTQHLDRRPNRAALGDEDEINIVSKIHKFNNLSHPSDFVVFHRYVVNFVVLVVVVVVIIVFVVMIVGPLSFTFFSSSHIIVDACNLCTLCMLNNFLNINTMTIMLKM